jgi:hypothetical protein
MLRELYPTSKAFSQTTIRELLDRLGRPAEQLTASTLASTMFLNRGDRFEAFELPREAQWAPVFATCVGDFDGDGSDDVFLSQNFFALRWETHRLDAGRGLWLRGDGQGQFEVVPGHQSGVLVYGEQRGAAVSDFDQDGRVDLVVCQNGAQTRLFRKGRGAPGLRVSLKGPAGNPTGVGALIRLRFGERWGAAREIHAGSGYWSQDSATAVLGCPATPTAVWVRWPGGTARVSPLPAGADEVWLYPDGRIEQR